MSKNVYRGEEVNVNCNMKPYCCWTKGEEKPLLDFCHLFLKFQIKRPGYVQVISVSQSFFLLLILL